MSGHSKWHSIRHKKALVDAKRGAVFTKMARLITVAAKEGGGDPDMNPSLVAAIAKAKAANMTKDNIEKAIKKGTGEGSEGVVFTESYYEGYAPGGVAVMVKALTDNTNRTVSHVRHAFSKHGGNMGDNGAVSFMFDKRGIIELEYEGETEKLELAIMESGAVDYKELDTNLWEVHTDPKELHQVNKALEGVEGLTIKDSKIGFVPKTTTELDDQAMEELSKFFEAMEDSDDIQELFSTVA